MTGGTDMGTLREVATLRPHSASGDVPSPDADTYDAMVVDIESRGVQVPLDIP